MVLAGTARLTVSKSDPVAFTEATGLALLLAEDMRLTRKSPAVCAPVTKIFTAPPVRKVEGATARGTLATARTGKRVVASAASRRTAQAQRRDMATVLARATVAMSGACAP